MNARERLAADTDRCSICSQLFIGGDLIQPLGVIGKHAHRRCVRRQARPAVPVLDNPEGEKP